MKPNSLQKSVAQNGLSISCYCFITIVSIKDILAMITKHCLLSDYQIQVFLSFFDPKDTGEIHYQTFVEILT